MTISASFPEARNRLGRLLRLASEENEDVVIRVRGEPTAVLVSYAAYEQLVQWKRIQKAQEALEKIRAAGAWVQAKMQGLSPEEACRRAGFGEQAIQELLAGEGPAAESEIWRRLWTSTSTSATCWPRQPTSGLWRWWMPA